MQERDDDVLEELVRLRTIELTNANNLLKEEIASRRLAEEKLYDSEEKFRSMFENSIDGIIYGDSADRILAANTAACRMHGRSEQELLEGGRDLILDTTDARRAALDEQLKISGGFVGEIRHIRKDGSSFPVEISKTVFRLSNGDERACVILRDITERVRMEKSLRTSRERLGLALRATNDAIWDWDLQADSYYCSPHWWRMLGYQADEIEVNQNTWKQLIHPDDWETAAHQITEALENQAHFKVEIRLRHKDGHYVPILTRGFVLRDENGKSIRAAGINTDLTEQKIIEAERRKLERRKLLIDKAESLNRMAGAIAHHFNNQLYVVIGNLELVMEHLPVGSEDFNGVINAMKASHKLADTSKLMLTYLGQTQGELCAQDLSEICHKGLLMLQPLIPKRIAVQTAIPFPGPAVQVNANQMLQVVTYLVTNAYESIENNEGVITVEVKTAPSAEIHASSVFPAGWKPGEMVYACLEVSDNGCGIKDANIDKIFDPFFTTKFVGRGLGLGVVLGIIDAHRGGISVESAAGKGSVFRVYLPLTAEPIPSAIQQTETPAEMIPNEMVLLIDDEPQVREMAKIMLNRLGYVVLEAKDGIDGLGMFERHRNTIRFVLTDLTMPRMSGWETLAALRKLSPAIPVILASGYNEEHVMAEAKKDLPDAFLGKPYGIDELDKTIRRVLAAASGASSQA